MNIETRQDKLRMCGWRKEGGLYLMGDSEGIACGKLPLPIGICPTCGHGVKVSRGFTWVDPVELFGDVRCNSDTYACQGCHLSTVGVNQMHNAGLIWVGSKFYPTPTDFTVEALNQGVSRRINSIPHQFILGKTWVFLAHRKGEPTEFNFSKEELLTGKTDQPDFIPTIFHAFLPNAIEYVVHPDDDEDKLERLVKKGVTLIRVERMDEQNEIIFKNKADSAYHKLMNWLKGADNVNQ